MIILGIDYGDARMGLAVCDKEERLAVSVKTEKVKSMTDAAQKAVKTAEERGAELIVIGMPARTDGFYGERCEKTQIFAEKLKALTNLEIVFYDERFSTLQAHRLLFDAGLGSKSHKAVVDALSAQIILQSYIDKKRAENEKNI